MACSYPWGREGSACGPLPILWGTNLRVACVALVGLYGLLLEPFGLGSVARDSNGPASMVEREGRARCETASDGTASGGKVRLGDNPSPQLAPLYRGPGDESRAAFSRFVLIHDDLRQPIPASVIVAIGTPVANNSPCAVPQQSLWPAGDFSCDCMFRDERGGGCTRQPLGPSVDTAIMTTVLSTNHVDSKSFSSRGCAFRRTHMSTDPIRLFCFRLALLSLHSRLAPGAKLMVGVSPRALWLAFFFRVTVSFGTVGEEC